MLSAALVIAEFSDGRASAPTLELLAWGRALAGRVVALAPGVDATAAQTLIAAGADGVFTVAGAASTDLDGDTLTACAAQAVRESGARVVLIAHNARGAEVAPRLAFRLDGAVATGCLQTVARDGAVSIVRPCYGGNARETLTLARQPVVLSMRSGTAAALSPDSARSGEVRALAFAAPAARTRVLERHRESGDDVRLEDARVVVAGGRGLDGPEGFDVLRVLAKQLGGAVGASRVPCDLGWCSHAMQIGLTGKTVTPELYVAVGISGAGHHLAGCGGAKTLVAINTDAEAPIFRHARYGIVGDYRQLVPALAAALAALPAQ